MENALRRGRRGGTRHLASVDQVGSGNVGRGRRITSKERVAIALLLDQGYSGRQIAIRLKRSPSTITREINRSQRVDGSYDAGVASRKAFERRARPKPLKLQANTRLREVVVGLLNQRYSPQQVAVRLRHLYPDDREMHVSVEAIYQALYVQGVGSLAQELKREKALRSGRKNRIPRSRLAGLPGRGRKTWVEGAQISMRPPQASDRAVPGHWEGDLVVGGGKDGHGTALITLVERRSRFVLMHRLGAGRDSKTVVDELVTMVKSLPGKFETITWDQGSEMAQTQSFTIATGVKVFFADPHSPWQRPSNERLNRDIREYFPKGTNFATITDAQVQEAQDELNNRARVVLKGATPHETLAQQLNDALTA
ncbi:IS30 family transposase [Arcanobacterium wilhelmae]|uniref:IS30 family transposase n=1 Tax=Arcanobacterium wilhelmae TaxID=1803177 RepID=UPI002415327E|nr:IS30 family transposase [Arcanobacterium wilhelmae]WFN90387.1 IS30 family transposase [Arcanobacterium wilhelmae]WFN90593.1 IS30 family transposase [Arcanobacterium wilhelmae]